MGVSQKSLEGFERRLETVILLHFPGSQVELDWTPRRARVTGLLVWEGFENLDQIERQRIIWDALRKQLDPVDQNRITAILTVTPIEFNAMREPIAA